MNWKEIEKKYPKAFESFQGWISHNTFETSYDTENFYYNSGSGEYRFNDRDIYDFFDYNEIYVITMSELDIDESVWHTGYIWTKEISCNDIKESKVRRVAETAAFEKAFEILNNKLKRYGKDNLNRRS